MGLRVYAAPALLLGRPDAPGDGAPWLRDGAIALDGERVAAVGPRAAVEGRYGRAERVDALLLPALVNAHTHLELSHLRGRVPGGEGLGPWVERLLAARDRDPAGSEGVDAAVGELREAGVAAVGEVSNTLDALPALRREGLAGTVFHEIVGFTAARVEASLSRAAAARARAGAPGPGLAIAPSPHAVYSTHPSIVAQLLRAGPASIHLAEDPAERLFCRDAAGPFADLVRALGARRVEPLGRSAVAVAAPHLGPRSLAVHAVDLDEEDVRDLAGSRATVVLCPRSNRHVGGRLPDVPRLLAAGIPLAVGSDSLASSPSLSPLAELAVLAEAFPRVGAGRLLPLAWNGAAVGAPDVGRLVPGTAPGVLAAALSGADPGPDPCAWLLRGAAGTPPPLAWIARHRPEGASS